MSVQFIELNLSEEAYEFNQDSVRTSDDDSKMYSTARTLDQSFEEQKTTSSEDVEPPSSNKPNISDDETEQVPPITVVPPSKTKDNTKNVKKSNQEGEKE